MPPSLRPPPLDLPPQPPPPPLLFRRLSLPLLPRAVLRPGPIPGCGRRGFCPHRCCETKPPPPPQPQPPLEAGGCYWRVRKPPPLVPSSWGWHCRRCRSQRERQGQFSLRLSPRPGFSRRSRSPRSLHPSLRPALDRWPPRSYAWCCWPRPIRASPTSPPPAP